MPNSKMIMSALLAVVLVVFVAAQAVPYPRDVPQISGGNKPSGYAVGKCYPNACVDVLEPTHWPFGGTPPLALVAAGSPPYGDLYNLTAHLKYLGITNIPYKNLAYLNNKTYGIAIGFTSLGEFVAQLADSTAGGISLATYNRPELFNLYESWTTNNIRYISPSDWLNGWTLSINATVGTVYSIYVHAFAVYSNRTHAGGGRGVVVNVTTPNTVPNKWVWMPLQYKPLTVIYDSPRLLVANGTVWFEVDLGKINKDLTGGYIRGRVWFTLVFPKAYPYAIVYYNYSVTADMASKLIPYPMTITGIAFSIRNEIDQANGLGYARTANATIFDGVTMGDSANRIYATLLQATPYGYPNVTFFEMLYPQPTEYAAWNLSRLVPSKLNNYKITLDSGFKNSSVANAIPFVIFQYRSNKPLTATAGEIATYSNGVMMIYGYAVNTTAWTTLKKPDYYIVRLLNYTVFVENKDSTQKYRNATVVPALGHMADVLGATYVAEHFRTYLSVLDIAPLRYGTLAWNPYPFLNQSRAGTVPVALCTLRGPFVDRYGRPFFKTWLFVDPATGMPLRRDLNKVPLTNYTIFTVAGPYPNLVTRMAQDFAWFAPFVAAYGDRFSGNNYTVASGFGGAVVSTVWNNITVTRGNAGWPVTPGSQGLGVVSKAVTPNGTVIVQVWGISAADTYWTSYLLSRRDMQSLVNGYPFGTYIIWIRYNKYSLPSSFDVYSVTPIRGIKYLEAIQGPFPS